MFAVTKHIYPETVRNEFIIDSRSPSPIRLFIKVNAEEIGRL